MDAQFIADAVARGRQHAARLDVAPAPGEIAPANARWSYPLEVAALAPAGAIALAMPRSRSRLRRPIAEAPLAVEAAAGRLRSLAPVVAVKRQVW